MSKSLRWLCLVNATIVVCSVGCATPSRHSMLSAFMPKPRGVASNALPSQQSDPVSRLPYTEEEWRRKSQVVAYEQEEAPVRTFRNSSFGGNCGFG